MASYRFGRRDELAAAKLDALGVDWDRSRGAYRQYRAMSVGQREQAIASLRARETTYRPGGRRQGEANPRRRLARAEPARYPQPLRSRQVGPDRVAETGNAATILGLVRDAAGRGDRVLIRMTATGVDGKVRTKDLDAAGDRSTVMDTAARLGSRSLGRSPGTGPAAPNKGLKPVTLTIGPNVTGPNADAFKATDWLAIFDAFDDVWDAIYAIWLADY